MRVVDIKKLIGSNCELIGDVEREFSSVRSIRKAQPQDLTFCNKKGEEATVLLGKTKASVVICNATSAIFNDKTLVIVDKPRLWFIRCMKAFFPSPHLKREIHPTTVIEDGVVIGKGVKIGKNVILHSGSVIGANGFGFERNENGIYERFPHIGSVVIGDNVEIGANTCVDRGALSDTIIGEGTKIDNLVHIGHNCIIGKNCIIAAMALVGGNVELEDGVWVGPHAVIVKGGVKVKRRALVGIGAVVLEDVPEESVVVGVPAKFLRKRRDDE